MKLMEKGRGLSQTEVLPVKEWARWWVVMWAVIFIGLITAVLFLEFWHWWTAAAIAFGVPEFLGTIKQDDQYPPLTHVLVHYVDREFSFPILYGLAGGIGAFWFGFAHPGRLGLLVGLIGWLTAHFGRRYEQKDAQSGE